MDDSLKIDMDDKDSKKDSNTIVEDTTCSIKQEQSVYEENNSSIEAEMNDTQVSSVPICKKSEWKSISLLLGKENCAENIFGECESNFFKEQVKSLSSSQEIIRKNEDVETSEEISSKTVEFGKIESTEESQQVVLCKNNDFKFTSSVEEKEDCSKNKFGDCELHFVQKQGEPISSSEEGTSKNEDIEKCQEMSSKNVECGKTESVEESQEVVICKNNELKSASSTDGEENSSKNKFEDCQSDLVQEHVASTSSTEENTSQTENLIKCEQSSNNDENTAEYEKSKLKSDLQLIKEALNHQLAADYSATSHRPYLLNPVGRDTPEFRKVSAIFSASCFDRKKRLYVEKIERIENPFLLALYLNKKEKMLRKNFSVREEDLFHGTSRGYVDSTCRNNFDWRRCGRSRGHKFGRGVSFTLLRYYGNSSLMILTKVLVSKSTIGGGYTVVPPENYDTTTNAPQTVFVKYEDDDFLPQYVVHYRSVSVSRIADDEGDCLCQ